MLRRSLIAGAAIATLTGETHDERDRRRPDEARPGEHAVHGPEAGPRGDPDVPRPRAEDGGADQDAGARGVLRQHAVPPGDRGLHGAGRRSRPAPARGGSKLPDLPAEFTTKRHFLRGTCGMARTSDPNSANSQFYIMFAPAPHLDGQYTIWGQVTQGMEFIDQIKRGSGGGGTVSESGPDRAHAGGGRRERLTAAAAWRSKAAGEPVAQVVEHETFNLGVVGSSPTGLTRIGY